MIKKSYLGLVAAAALLAGCVGADVDQLRDADLSGAGSAFNQQLASEYRALAIFEGDEMVDWKDADYFAKKGLAAAAGESVGPTDLSEWNISADQLDELRTARASLVQQLDGGARESNPVDAAMAQARFDCWAEQAEENFQPDDIAACRDEFYALLEKLDPVAAAADVYIVFFDWDSSDITSDAADILNDAAADYAAGGFAGIDVVGHADRSGSDAYNVALSMRRAEAVKASLAGLGVPEGSISTDGVGESQPLVETPDGVREPSNRRAEIRFE
ncbi:MAG: OmpA family protein [Pseudomonadota bacterium]